MGRTVNLGGDRVGSGAKMNVEQHEWQKSTHDLSKVTRTTMAAGTLVPIYTEFAQQGDNWEIDLDSLILTHPTNGPLFGTMKVQIDVFSAPIRLYQGKLHMNLLQSGTSMENIKFPRIKVEAAALDWDKELDGQQINPSSILAYQGIRGIGNNLSETYRHFNAIPTLMYYDTYGQYYANQQEKVGYIIHSGKNAGITKAEFETNQVLTPINSKESGLPGLGEVLQMGSDQAVYITASPSVSKAEIYLWVNGGGADMKVEVDDVFEESHYENGVWTFNVVAQMFDQWTLNWYEETTVSEIEPQLFQFPLENINEMKLDILAAIKETGPFTIDGESPAPYGTILKKVDGVYPITNDQEGLAVKTYQSDLFNNWLNTEDINALNNRATVSTAGEGFTMESFLMVEKLYKYLNAIQLAGNTTEDWMQINWGSSGGTRHEKPIWEGGLSKELIFEEVVSQTAGTFDGVEQPIGTLAGKGKLSGKHKGGKVRIKIEEHSFIMVIASITPRIDYSQGVKWWNNLETLEDIHKSAFDRIAFQNLNTDQMAYWDTVVDRGNTTFRTAGKQPAWINYQTNYNEVYGNFAITDKVGWMVLKRDYEPNTTTKRIKDLTTYIDPKKWNNQFSYARRDAQNYWGQFSIEAKVRRIMSANQIPNL